ncbi:MAG: hypothetical protein FJ279_22760, partial [Planctomycetes bacterium]|nr:hypothetical protein [Planctomycetota bacterium]
MNRRRRDLLFAAIGVAAWAIASVALGANRMDWPDPRWVLKPGARPSDALSKPVSLAEGAKRGLVAVSPSPGGDVLTLKPVGAAYSVVWQEKLATPHRVQYDFRGLGTMTACVVSVDARKHWALDLGLLAIYANDKRQSQHPSGWYKATPSGEYDQRKWWRVTIENFQDFSRVKVAERDTGFLLADYEHVAHEPVSAADLELAKVGEKQALDIEFANVTVETGLAAATPSAPPSPPAGHRVHFFDAFCGQAAKWGSPRYLPGALTLPKKDYFTFAYPVFIPDLSFSDGVIEAEVLLPPNAHGEIRVRVNPFGDGYYAFQFGLGRAAQFVKSLNVAQASEPIGKSLGVRCRPGRWNRLRIQADGPQLSASIDGEPSATATDAAHATGEVCLVGSEAAPVTFGQLVLFAKEGVPGQRSQPPGGPNLFGGSPNKLGTPAAMPTGQTPRGNLLDADGRTHRYALRDGVLEYDGQPFVPVRDSDGQYFVLYEPARWPAKAWEKLRCADTLREVARHGLTYPIVRLQLVDYVDCTRDDHGFHEDGGIGGRSRVLRLGDDEYRVTSCRKPLPPYFVYSTAFESVGKAHVVAYQVPNDRERYLSVNPIPTESGSGGVYTGGNYPVDGKSYLQMHV